MEPGCQTQSLI